MTCDFGDLDQDRRDGDIIGSDLVRRRLRRKGVKDILRKAYRGVLRYIVGVVRVGARFEICHSDAGIGSRARKVCREIKVQQFISEWMSVRGAGGRTVTDGKYLEGPGKF